MELPKNGCFLEGIQNDVGVAVPLLSGGRRVVSQQQELLEEDEFLETCMPIILTPIADYRSSCKKCRYRNLYADIETYTHSNADIETCMPIIDRVAKKKNTLQLGESKWFWSYVFTCGDRKTFAENGLPSNLSAE